ncbi:MAG: DegT/DnrJ/EryC1/StrS family aminotransferase [Patescibacteria group bacterium]|mgnify:CR=1 FL=1
MIKLIESSFYREQETKEALIRFIRSAKRFSCGDVVESFERQFAKYQGRRDSIFFHSGSSANLGLIQALMNMGKLKRGDSVGFSAVTWATNVMPLMQLGLKPVPIDVELNTLNVSSAQLKKVLVKHSLQAIFLTNLLGFCDDLDKIEQLCKKHKILLIEDNCEGLGTVYRGKRLGNYSYASTFSFFVGHHLSTIEGGAICTDDPKFSSMLRMVRAHGWDRSIPSKEQVALRKQHRVNHFYSRFTFYELGYNLRPTEIQGFLGNLQLKYFPEIAKKRNKNFLQMAKVLYANTEKYIPLRYDHIDFISAFSVPLVCRSKKILEKLIKQAKGKVEIRPIVGGDITEQPFYRKHGEVPVELPNAQIVHRQGLYLSCDPELSQKDIKTILDVFAK